MNQIETGILQFEWAIKLYLYENAFVPAITLAGAAEGIFGEIKSGYIFHQVSENIAIKNNLQVKLVSKEINKVRNWLKHGSCHQSFTELSEQEFTEAAISRIIIAATALIHLKPDYMSNLFIKFMQHTQTHYSDFLPDDNFDWNKIEIEE
ncbi:hypothetical protein [Acinetobacter pittii]|uniref:hypothetical protein n=1 Tax=Acinetobacter pittii TaxID=48296 RepID=UPI00062A6887|nr:hypothetical protein [Acinetobacter pittii]MCH2070060.1 hypothetical protein [Acinetobacter pittii]TDM65323.1 hypothetical protein C5B72_06220 [Acinetobacter sp. KU 011TH]TDM65810.1 hypothetical protein C4608_06220 [Acinetobacter sp. KU 013TH]TGU91300.1 hypothetical protein YA64_000380 [Acinetobacter pittii]